MSSPFSGSGLGGQPLSPRHERRGGAEPVAADPPRPGTAAQWKSTIESPQQREIAGQIYTRLKSGADVGEVTDLIEQLRGAVSRRARTRAQGDGQ